MQKSCQDKPKSKYYTWKIKVIDVNYVEQTLGDSGPHKIYLTSGTPYGSVVSIC